MGGATPSVWHPLWLGDYSGSESRYLYPVSHGSEHLLGARLTYCEPIRRFVKWICVLAVPCDTITFTYLRHFEHERVKQFRENQKDSTAALSNTSGVSTQSRKSTTNHSNRDDGYYSDSHKMAFLNNRPQPIAGSQTLNAKHLQTYPSVSGVGSAVSNNSDIILVTDGSKKGISHDLVVSPPILEEELSTPPPEEVNSILSPNISKRSDVPPTVSTLTNPNANANAHTYASKFGYVQSNKLHHNPLQNSINQAIKERANINEILSSTTVELSNSPRVEIQFQHNILPSTLSSVKSRRSGNNSGNLNLNYSNHSTLNSNSTKRYSIQRRTKNCSQI